MFSCIFIRTFHINKSVKVSEKQKKIGTTVVEFQQAITDIRTIFFKLSRSPFNRRDYLLETCLQKR